MTDTSIDQTPTPPVEEQAPGGGLRGRISAIIQHKEFERFWKFAIVGTVGAVIDNGTFNGTLALGWLQAVELNLPFGATITEVGLAGTLAFVLAVINNFIWNRYWTYPDSRSKSIVSQLVTFFLVNVVGIFIRIPILELTSQPISNLIHSIIPTLSDGVIIFLGKNGAWGIAVVVVMFWNFFVNRYWTYNDVD